MKPNNLPTMSASNLGDSRTNSVVRSSAEGSLRNLTATYEVSVASLIKCHEMLMKTESDFHEACRTNDIEQMKRLLSDDEDVNIRDQLDRSGLHYASANGHEEVVAQLFVQGADDDSADKHGMTGMLWASWFGHVSVVQFLMKKCSNVSVTNMHGMNLFHCAVQNNQMSIVQYLVDIIQDPQNAKDKYKICCDSKKEQSDFHDRINEVRFNLNGKNKFGQSSFHLAASLGHIDCLKMLYPLVKDVNEKDVEGNTSLYGAAERGHSKVVRWLVENGADVNMENLKGSTPLMVAVTHNDVQLVNCLILHSANVNDKNLQGNTALHAAASSSSSDVVQTLINHHADVNAQNNRMLTALHVGVDKASVEVVEVLLQAGADLHVQEKSGKTALGLASRGSLIGIVDMIIKAEHDQNCDKENLSDCTQCHNHHYCFYKTSCNAFDGSFSELANLPNTTDHSKSTSKGESDFLKTVYWKLATKQLKATDWKALAKHWHFNENHIKAIEHQYTGNESYKEHGYRLLLIWYHGLEKNENPIKKLFEALVAIGRRELAEEVRQRCNIEVEKPPMMSTYCKVS